MTFDSIDPELLANPAAVLATNGHDGYPQADRGVVRHRRRPALHLRDRVD